MNFFWSPSPAKRSTKTPQKKIGENSERTSGQNSKNSGNFRSATLLTPNKIEFSSEIEVWSLVAHDCGYPLSRYTCRATRVAADFLDFIAFCRCSTGVALHPLTILVSHLPPPCPGRCRTEIWVWKGVALHGGFAATVAGVALHCATEVSSETERFKRNCFFQDSGP